MQSKQSEMCSVNVWTVQNPEITLLMFANMKAEKAKSKWDHKCPALMFPSHLPPHHLNYPLLVECTVGRPLALPFRPMWPKRAAGILSDRRQNHLRLLLSTAEARWCDTAEPGIVSNAFIHSPSHWQTLWNGWNPSLVEAGTETEHPGSFPLQRALPHANCHLQATASPKGGLVEWVCGWGKVGRVA